MSDPIRDALRVAAEQHNRCGRDAAGCANRPGCVCRREGAEFVAAFLREWIESPAADEADGITRLVFLTLAAAVERAARGDA